MTKLFLFEYFTGGGVTEAMRDAMSPAQWQELCHEGGLMAGTLLGELAALPGHERARLEVLTTFAPHVDAGLRAGLLRAAQGLQIELVELADSRSGFDELAARCDLSWIIAPETSGMLANLIERSELAGCRSLGCTADAVEIAGSKWRTAVVLRAAGVPVVPTVLVRCDELKPMSAHGPVSLPEARAYVVKPDDGVGSTGVHVVVPEDATLDPRGLVASLVRMGVEGLADEGACVVQPHVPGDALSVSAHFGAEGAQWLGLNRQMIEEESIAEGSISKDSIPKDSIAKDSIAKDSISEHAIGSRKALAGLRRLRFSGSQAAGEPLEAQWRPSLEPLLERIAMAIPGLNGYVGIDFIGTRTGPVIVEINPRLTTSYAHLDRARIGSIARRMLQEACAR